MQFNASDGLVDRRSVHGTYVLAKGRPLNPTGRKGIAGRGALRRWGPNTTSYVAVTRWLRSRTGEVQVKGGRQVLEVLLVTAHGELALPRTSEAGGLAGVVSARCRERVAQLTRDTAVRDAAHKAIEDLMLAPQAICHDAPVDPRNTDNAWSVSRPACGADWGWTLIMATALMHRTTWLQD